MEAGSTAARFTAAVDLAVNLIVLDLAIDLIAVDFAMDLITKDLAIDLFAINKVIAWQVWAWLSWSGPGSCPCLTSVGQTVVVWPWIGNWADCSESDHSGLDVDLAVDWLPWVCPP